MQEDSLPAKPQGTPKNIGVGSLFSDVIKKKKKILRSTVIMQSQDKKKKIEFTLIVFSVYHDLWACWAARFI